MYILEFGSYNIAETNNQITHNQILFIYNPVDLLDILHYCALCKWYTDQFQALIVVIICNL